MNIRKRFSIVSLYYYITPAFILLDHVGGMSIRATALDSLPLYKNLYYGFCTVCGVSVFVWPWLSPVAALFESSVNFLMTVLAIFMPYFRFIRETDDVMTAELPTMVGFDVPHIVNILLAGGIAILGFHGSLRAIGLEGGRNDLSDDQFL